MKRTVFCLLALITIAVSAGAGEHVRPVEADVPIAGREQLERLSALVSVEGVRDGEASVVLSPEQVTLLRDEGFEVHPRAAKTTAVTMCPSGWEDLAEPTWNCYPTYAQYEAFLDRLAAEHPALCRLHDLGRTTNLTRDHHLWALEITADPDVDNERPEVLLTSSMHGDELAGFIVSLRLAYTLLDAYGTEAEATAAVDDLELWINPLANPDGTYYGSDTSVDGAIRFLTTERGTSSWVDPNRNFPDPRKGPHPDGNPWWRETEIMMALAADHHFVLSANLHGGAEVVNYPWDTWCSRHPDDAWFYDLGVDWATAAQEDGPAGYMDDCYQPQCGGVGCTPGVTEGADWYTVTGGRQDYMTYFRGDREVTVEMSSTKLPPTSQLGALWTANRRAVFGFLDAARVGIHGTVLDDAGRPLAATVEVLDHDTTAARSAVTTDPGLGDFHRLLPPGLYDLRISSLGRQTRVIAAVQVPEGPPYPDLLITLDRVPPLERPSDPEAVR